MLPLEVFLETCPQVWLGHLEAHLIIAVDETHAQGAGNEPRVLQAHVQPRLDGLNVLSVGCVRACRKTSIN